MYRKLIKSRHISKYMLVFYICLVYVVILLFQELYSTEHNHVNIVNKVYRLKNEFAKIYSSIGERKVNLQNKNNRAGLERSLEGPHVEIAYKIEGLKDGKFTKYSKVPEKKHGSKETKHNKINPNSFASAKQDRSASREIQPSRRHANSEPRGQGCPKLSIFKKYADEVVPPEQLACIPHKPSSQDCQYANEVYKIDPHLQRCKDPHSRVFCTVQLDKLKAPSRMIKVECDQGRHNCKKFILRGLNSKTGNTEKLISVSKIEKLEEKLKEIATKAIEQMSNFMFIGCVNDKGKITAKQLVVLPSVKLDDKPYETKNRANPNVNIVLLDSISRAHFYRSLPMVIKTFNVINKKSDTEIIDFELFQSVHGHSAENFRALFTGKLFPKKMTDAEKQRSVIGIHELMGEFKNAGYETMGQDDLCWKNWWGMRMDLGSPSNWTSFVETLRKANIDMTGLSHSSCDILAENNVATPFNGPKSNQICFNGRFQHSYIFQFLHQFHKETHLYETKPRLSFTGINTAHDYTGLRVQTLNLDLSKFVEEMSVLPNTLTILLADHGNTYTRYTNAVMEGRYEMYHPSLFMIIPRGVAEYFGADVMNSLRLNSKRLFTMLDLHASLKTIARKAKNEEVIGYQGILQTIPTSRTCDDLNLRLPNLCVCEGWDTEVHNDTKQIGVLEFAVGTLNNMILKQQESQSEFTTKCHRLYPLYFLNVRERSSGEHLIITMDFKVKAGFGADQNEDIFHVEIQSTINPEKDSMNMKLLSFDRLSQYGIYRRCQDERVDTRLCVCSLNVQRSEIPAKSSMIDLEKTQSSQPSLPGIPALVRFEKLNRNSCIQFVQRTYYKVDKKGVMDREDIWASALEVINLCSNRKFRITLKTKTSNSKISREIPVVDHINGNTVKFLLLAKKYFPYWKSTVKLDYSVAEIK